MDLRKLTGNQQDTVFKAVPVSKDFTRIKQLIAADESAINRLDSDNKTALYYAIADNNLGMVKFLVGRGADVNVSHIREVHNTSRLVHRFKLPVLTYAILSENTAVVEVLLTAGANIDHQVVSHSREKKYFDQSRLFKYTTALHTACAKYNVNMVALLLQHNADVNIQGLDGNEPLHVVANSPSKNLNATEILKLLCAHGADVNFPNKMMQYPLYLSCLANNMPNAEVLLLYGADPDAISRGTSALHLAARRDSLELLELLILYRVNLNVREGLGSTALRADVTANLTSRTAALLIYHGADVNTHSSDDKPLLQLILVQQRLDCETLCDLVVHSGYRFEAEDASQLAGADSSAASVGSSPRMHRLRLWLKEKQCTPLSLYELCRVSVRHHLSLVNRGRSIVGSVRLLGLPKPVTEYLLFLNLYQPPNC